MEKRILIAHVPVLHQGYLDFLKKNKKRISSIFLLGNRLVNRLSRFEPDITSIEAADCKKLLRIMGFDKVQTFSLNTLKEIYGKKILLINDEVSRNLNEKYFKGGDVKWASVFLRWDKESIVAEMPVKNVPFSKNPFDIAIMKKAYDEAQKSSDWWRQAGAVLLKNGEIILRTYNQALPTDHSIYQVGGVRDFFAAGERQDLNNIIHAEQRIIAEAAKNGLSLNKTALYLTHFPCSVCAKLIVYSGIRKIYFCEGASTLDGRKMLKSAGIKIIRLPMLK
ncbi:MAG: deaminase [bacterium]|nr:deaminase [bacterium]